MLEALYPDTVAKSAYAIDYGKLWEDGYRGIIYDIDNTLVPHGAPANARAVRLFQELGKKGFLICLISNNQKERVEMFNRDVNVHYLENAHKPSRKGYLRAMELMGTKRRETVSIGDQIFTDVWGSKRAGLYTILVGQIGKKEEIQIVLKRILEKIVLHFYYKNKRYGKGYRL